MKTTLCLMSATDGAIAGPGELGVIERDADGLPVLIRAAVERVEQVAVDNGLKLILPTNGAAQVVRYWSERKNLDLPIDLEHGTHQGEGVNQGAVGWMVPEVGPGELRLRVKGWEQLGRESLTGVKMSGEGALRFRYSSPSWVPVAKDKQGRFVIGGVLAMALTNKPRTSGIKALMPLHMSGAGGIGMEISVSIPDDLAAKLPEGGTPAGMFGALMLYVLGDDLYGVGAEGDAKKLAPAADVAPVDMSANSAVLAMSQRLEATQRELAANSKAAALMASQLKALAVEKAERDLLAMSARVDGLALHGVPQPEILAFHDRLKSGQDIGVEVGAFERLPKLPTAAAPNVAGKGDVLTKEAYFAMSTDEQNTWLDKNGANSFKILRSIGAM